MQRTQEQQSQSDQVTTPEAITRGGANSLKNIFTVRRLAGLALVSVVGTLTVACDTTPKVPYHLVDGSGVKTWFDSSTSCDEAREKGIKEASEPLPSLLVELANAETSGKTKKIEAAQKAIDKDVAAARAIAEKNLKCQQASVAGARG